MSAVALALALSLAAPPGPAPAGETSPETPAAQPTPPDAPAEATPGEEPATGEAPAEEPATGEAPTEELPGVLDEPGEPPAPPPEPEPSLPPPRIAPEPAEEGPEPGFDPTRDSPEAIRARGWLRSGIVAASTGLALGVLAIVLGTRDPCARLAGNSCFRSARDRAALTAGIPGAVLLAGGVAMLTVGAVRLKRIKAEARVTPTVDLGTGYAGIVVGGRF